MRCQMVLDIMSSGNSRLELDAGNFDEGLMRVGRVK